MSKKRMTQLLGILVAAMLIMSNLQTASAQPKTGTGGGGNPLGTDAPNVSSTIQRPITKTALDPNKLVRVIVQLSDPASASYTGGTFGYKPTSPKAIGSKTIDIAEANVVSYERYLRGKQTEFVNTLSAALPEAKTQRSYQTVLNAVVVQLPAAKVEALSKLPGVIKVAYEQERKLQMDASLPLIGLGTGTVGGTWTDAGLWDTLGGHQNAGKGIRIADIDSGITPSNPCFNPAGFTMPLGFPKGESAITNAKIIAARSYYRADDPPFLPATALDDTADYGGGHGTHTAGTMVCNYGTTTTEGVKISGVAPAAQLMAYKVFYRSISGSESAYTPELIAAIEDAVRDGAQVVNNSWGGTNINAVDDLETIAYEGAVDAGVVVVFSAGNSGPNTYTMGSPGGNSEKFITVAASTTNRIFAHPVSVTGGDATVTSLPGAVSSGPVISTDIGPLPYISSAALDPANILGCNAFAPNAFNNAIALIKRGSCVFSDKVNNAHAAGAVAVIIYNSVSGVPTSMAVDGTTIPSVMVSDVDGASLIAWLNAHSGAQLTIGGTKFAAINNTWQDQIASFSSVGPNPDLTLKPDISAPGVNILSSVSPAEYGTTTAKFELYQGTSMAAPHVTGAAALMLQAHPGWTPAQIRSALMTSAAEPSSLGTNPISRGAGRLDLTKPDKVALTFDHPSLSFQLAQIGVMKSITVTAHNVTAADVTYWMGVLANPAATAVLKVDGVPAKSLTVPAYGDKSFTLELTGVNAGTAYGKVYFTLTAPNSLNIPAPTYLLHLPYYAVVTAASTLADVYLVDGDSSPASGCTDYAKDYEKALTDAGLTYTYAEISPNYPYAGFDFNQARLHKWVLYFDGDPRCGGWLTYPYAAALRNYLAQGGKMLAMGQDIAWLDSNLAPLGYTFTPELFLGARYLQDNLFAGATDLKAAGDSDYSPFVAGMVLPLDPTTATSVDEVAATMYSDTDMVPLFVNKNAPAAIGGSYAGVIGTRASSEPTIERVKTGKNWTKLPYRTLFTTFGLENILETSLTSYRADLLTKANEWFMDQVSIEFEQPSFRTSHLDVAVPISAMGVSSEKGQILYMRVDYGDGSPVDTFAGNTVSIGHKYPAWGNYTATVEAVDEYGHKTVRTVGIEVGSLLYLPLIGGH